eukprot:scaffold276_cov116-Isochrysis_galbana.AAC.2
MPKASPFSTMRAPRSDQFSVRISREAGATASLCVTCGARDWRLMGGGTQQASTNWARWPRAPPRGGASS